MKRIGLIMFFGSFGIYCYAIVGIAISRGAL